MGSLYSGFHMFIFVFILSEISLVSGSGQPKVTIAQGVIRGTYTKTLFKRKIASFQGIPFAKPPIGNLRFKEPQPPDHWTDIYEAKKTPQMCLQFESFSPAPQITGSEDCLYLNVYTPQLPSTEQSKLLDVIAYIHGGAFTMGKSWDHGPLILLERDFVLVTFNFRLGPLGFLSTEDNVAPGNIGLKDQVFALEWIQQNIAAFGGNPKSVTIAGSSSGAASCGLHLLSPLSKGLFKGAIMMGGVATNPWAIIENSKEKAKIIAANLDCPTEDSLPMIECLRDRPAEKIVNTVKLLMNEIFHPFVPLGPVVEPVSKNAFISDLPINILKQKKASDVPVVFSFTPGEGALFLSNPVVRNKFKNDWYNVVQHFLDYNFTVQPDKLNEVSKRIREFYKIENEPNETSHYVKVVGDRLIQAGISKIIKVTATYYSSPIYVYKFSYKGKMSLLNVLRIAGFDNIELDKYVAHADDILYTIGILFFHNMDSATGIKLTKQMQDMWVSFAANGTLKENWQPAQERLSKIIFTDIKGPDNFVLTEADELGEETFWDSLGIDENIESKAVKHEEL